MYFKHIIISISFATHSIIVSIIIGRESLGTVIITIIIIIVIICGDSWLGIRVV
jgi:hypothetical protein